MFVALLLSLATTTGDVQPGGDSVPVIRLAPGSPLLRVDRIASRTDSGMISVTANGATRPGPIQIESIRRTTRGGRPVLEHRILVEGRRRLDDTTWYDPGTLAPLAHRSHSADRTLSLDYTGGRVRGAIEDSAGAHPIDQPAPEAFDPSALHPVLRSLALQPATYLIPFFNHEERTVRVDTVMVEGPDQVTSATGPVAVWRLVVAAAGRRAIYYVRQDDGVELKVVVRFGGGEMTIVHPGVR